MNPVIILIYLLLSGITATYTILLWYGAEVWAAFFIQSDYGSVPFFSTLFLAPLPLPIWYHMIHWQTFAILSLLCCIVWGAKRSRVNNSDAAHLLPITLHTLWIIFVTSCHLVAAVLPMFAVGKIIL
ncbi:MAG: hypothetical protein KAR01_10810 [Desulfocapsa sp.]|nr:hypothetical protein [Desulfocapsa sp.]